MRYYLLHSIHSSVKISKVTYGGQIVAGLECTKPIHASTYILTAGASMSSDNYGMGGGLSVIMRGARQLGPENERLILGPLRFANHECRPNCQVRFDFVFTLFSENLKSDNTYQGQPCTRPICP
jgi:hypothetical protein